MAPLKAQEVIDTQRQDWNRAAPAWEKWDDRLDQNMAFINHRLVADGRLRPGQRVLDLGSGTGYPAVLAAQAVGVSGRVVGLDLADRMLHVARCKAERLGLSNIRFQTADVTSLPFDAASYDAVLSRFCLMFLPDIPQAMREIARVLKPGGYFAAAVWSAVEKNPFISIPMEVLKTFLTLPQPDPEQPGIFRLAKAGELYDIAQRAGLTGLADDEVTGESCYDSAEEYLTSLLDMAAPLQPLFAKLSADQRRDAEAQITAAANRYKRGEGVALPMAIRIVSARKPLPAGMGSGL
jgi:ubiquinone/menaquinone biosynthesis C-methylase UbiE